MVWKVGLNDSAGQISRSRGFLLPNGLEKGYSSDGERSACDA